MNLLTKLIQWWQRRNWPKATEEIQRGTMVSFTDKTKSAVRVANPAQRRAEFGIALTGAKKGEEVMVVIQRGSFTIPSVNLPPDIFKQ